MPSRRRPVNSPVVSVTTFAPAVINTPVAPTFIPGTPTPELSSAQQPEPSGELQLEPSSEPQPEPPAQPIPPAESEPSSEPEPEPSSEPEPEPPAAEPESSTETEATAEPEPEPSAEPEPEPSAEPEPEPEPAAEVGKTTASNSSSSSSSRVHKYTPRADFHPMDCTDLVIGMARGNYSRIGDFYSRDRSLHPFNDSTIALTNRHLLEQISLIESLSN